MSIYDPNDRGTAQPSDGFRRVVRALRRQAMGETLYPDQCRFCSSRECFVRIHTDDGRFDEVACRDHSRLLEQFADGALKGAMRRNLSSSARVKRDRLHGEQPRIGKGGGG